MVTATATTQDADVALVRAGVAARCAAGEAYFSRVAGELASCAAAMAERFFAGATLLVFGSGAGSTDAEHNSVEYVHPVLPGCRALSALSLSNDISTVTGILAGPDPDDVHAHQLRVLGRPVDITLAFIGAGPDRAAVRGLRAAVEAQMLTVALSAGTRAPDIEVDHLFNVEAADPLVAQEMHLATYHMLWELTHIVLNHRGIAEARP